MPTKPQISKIAWTPVIDSSNVRDVYFHEFHEYPAIICVRFNNGAIYSYMGGTMEMFMGLVHAPSVGRYLHNVLKALPYTRWESEEALLQHLNH